MPRREDMNRMKLEFLEQLNLKKKQIEELTDTVEVLKNILSKLEERVEDAEAYERKDTHVMSGTNIPPVVPGENCVTLVCDLLKTALKLNIQPSDTSTAHRVGRKPVNQQVDKRNIIMKLCRRDIKSDILHACRQWKPKFNINESLTPTRNSVMYVLRCAKKKQQSRVVGCSSIGGRVFAWIKSPNGSQQDGRGRRIPVNTRSELEVFCLDVLGEPLSNYFDRWQH